MSTYSFPIRLNTSRLTGTSVTAGDVRKLVSAAAERELNVDETAFEILCTLAGETVIEPASLARVTERLLTRSSASEANQGPLSQAGVLGAVFGIAHFMLHTGGEWLLAVIPIGRVPAPDIYAVRPRGRPWYLELKGIAPLSAATPRGSNVDVCGKVKRRLDRAALQLNHESPIPVGTPQQKLAQGPLLKNADRGGVAMSAIVLPDGMLAGRRDLRPVNLSSCPPGKRCADACLASHLPSHRTSLIGLLWERENVMSRTSRGDNWKSTLGAVQALNLALWAGSTATADEALMQIAARAERLREDLRLTVVESALAISRGVTSRGTRRDVAADILPASIADFEYDMGVATPPRVVSLDAFLRGDTSPEEPYEVFFRGNGYSGTGRVIDGRWRSVPTVQAWDAALESGNLQAPLDSASDGLRQMMSRLEQREHEAQTLQSRYIRSGDKSWEVGRERRLALLPHFEKIPPHLRATARAASLRALDGPDCRLMHEFVRRHGDELRRAGVDLGLLDASAHFDWRRLGEATQPASAWAAVDGRISIPL